RRPAGPGRGRGDAGRPQPDLLRQHHLGCEPVSAPGPRDHLAPDGLRSAAGQPGGHLPGGGAVELLTRPRRSARRDGTRRAPWSRRRFGWATRLLVAGLARAGLLAGRPVVPAQAPPAKPTAAGPVVLLRPTQREGLVTPVHTGSALTGGGAVTLAQP